MAFLLHDYYFKKKYHHNNYFILLHCEFLQYYLFYLKFHFIIVHDYFKKVHLLHPIFFIDYCQFKATSHLRYFRKNFLAEMEHFHQNNHKFFLYHLIFIHLLQKNHLLNFVLELKYLVSTNFIDLKKRCFF